MRNNITIIAAIFALLLLLFNTQLAAKKIEYGSILCKQPGYQCLKIKRANSWSQLFPNASQRDLVKRVNRTNDFLQAGMVIAVPDNLETKTLFDVSPFPRSNNLVHDNLILVDQKQLAWAAYNKTGQLLRWGPISAGTDRCFESAKGCLTPVGTFYVNRKQGKDCVSKSLPQTYSGEKGGASMPYCMYFHQGFALHGSSSLPGFHASHGCIRLFIEDSKWLNERFVQPTSSKGLGTKIVVKSIE